VTDAARFLELRCSKCTAVVAYVLTEAWRQQRTQPFETGARSVDELAGALEHFGGVLGIQCQPCADRAAAPPVPAAVGSGG
jgi:hypothetical protein